MTDSDLPPDGVTQTEKVHHQHTPAPASADGDYWRMDDRTLQDRLNHIAAHVERLAAARGVTHGLHQPAWLRRTAEEPRLPVAFAVLVAIALQAVVKHDLTFRPWWLLPGLELLLLVVIILFRQTKMDRQSTVLRVLGISIVAAAGLATAWSAGNLIQALVTTTAASAKTAVSAAVEQPGPLLLNGGAIWLTNVIVFALLYWEMDRGGPVARACATHSHVDFLFAQMTAPEFVDHDWEPGFVDYLYLSFTNSTAFSPTDTLPMTKWAKLTMMFQSVVSLVTVALVVARAVNVLGG